MKGLNVTVNIIERAQGADDAVGGSVRTDAPRYSGVRARIANLKPSSLLAQQGFETRHIHDIIIYPAHLYPNVREEDIVIPQDGHWAGARFKVIGVQASSVRPGNPRSHIQLRCERIRYADDNQAG